jgi:hypothetical protein
MNSRTGASGAERLKQVNGAPMKRFVALLLTGLLLVSAAGSAFGKQTGQPHPQPPKCVPANTPGCS